MHLSNTDIERYRAAGDITIEPYNPSYLKPGSYVFTLDTKLYKSQPGVEVDATAPDLHYDIITMGPEGYVLQPGEFILGQTAEQLTLSTKIACRADVRTTLARLGVMTVLSSTFVEPGQSKSHEALEIVNLSQNPVRLKPGMKIVKALFFTLETPATVSYEDVGRYAGQHDPRPR